MTNDIKISREQLEKCLRDATTIRFEDDKHVLELRALLADPVVERQEPVAWTYCPECGSEDLHHEQGEHKQCANCHQEWFSDIDYSEVVRGNLEKLKASPPASVAVVLEYGQTCPCCGEYKREIGSYQTDPIGPMVHEFIPFQPACIRCAEPYVADPVVERQPIGWFTDDYLTDKSSTTYDELTSNRWKDKGWPVQPLFTLPPAPVAVVLPERDEDDIGRFTDGWNACLDKAKELNQ